MARKTMSMAKLVLLLALALVLLATIAPYAASAQRILRADGSARALSAAQLEPVGRALETTTTPTSSSSKASSAAAETLSESESNTASTTAESKTETHPEGPSLSSFTGPMLAGAVAILLIGFVIAFKNRKSSS